MSYIHLMELENFNHLINNIQASVTSFAWSIIKSQKTSKHNEAVNRNKLRKLL